MISLTVRARLHHNTKRLKLDSSSILQLKWTLGRTLPAKPIQSSPCCATVDATTTKTTTHSNPQNTLAPEEEPFFEQ